MSFTSRFPSFRRAGFTLVELLLVIMIVTIVAAIVIIAINPAKQLSRANNAQRRSNIATIASALERYAADHSGQLPETISSVPTEICKTGGLPGSCGAGIDLSALTANELYLSSIPFDPTAAGVATGTGYVLFYTTTTGSSFTIAAPKVESAETISITRTFSP